MANDTHPTTTQNDTGAPSMAPASAWEPDKRLSPRQRRQRIHLVLIGILVAAYIAGGVYFSSHFTPGTTVDGIDAGLLTQGELAEALQNRAATYAQHLSNEDGFDLTLQGTDIALSFDGAKVASEAQERTSPVLWLPYLLTPHHMLIDGNIQVDEEALASLIGTAVDAYNQQAVAPTDATAAYDKNADAFVATPESIGTALDAEPIVQASLIACRELRGEVALDESALLRPSITRESEPLVEGIKLANQYLNETVEVTADGEVIASPERELRIDWISVDNATGEVKVWGITNWVNHTDAILDAGNAIDDEHVWALDAKATGRAILKQITKGGGQVEIVRTALETKPAVTPGAKERGRHIDVNLTTQFCRFYDKDGTVIWDSYCVTGGYDTQFGDMHETPTGNFAIEGKQTNRTLIGPDRDDDKKPDYESFVYYWMPFLNNDYGFHDATWRSEDGFGGEIRYWYGSHGCINLPYAKAEELFNLVQIGDAVYIHE